MFIVHFIGTNFVGGPEKQILSHLCDISGSGYRLKILSFAETGGYEMERASRALGVPCELLTARKTAVLAVLRRLREIQRIEQPAIICAHGYKAMFYALLLKVLEGVKVIGFSRGWTAENLTVKAYGWVDKILIRYADRVVAVSHSQADKLRKLRVPESKIRVIHNAVTDFQRITRDKVKRDLRAELGLAETAFVILTVGRLSPEKGQADLVRAAEKVLAKQPKGDIHFVIAGNGPLEKDLAELVRALNLEHRVHLVGFRSDVGTLYAAADLFVLPSYSEGLPNVLLEAMTASVPVVSTNVGGVPELVADGRSGLLTEPGNPGALAEAMIALIADPVLRARLVAGGLESVRGKFSRGQQSRLLVQLYGEVVGR